MNYVSPLGSFEMRISCEIRREGSECGPLPKSGFIVDYDSLQVVNGLSGCILIDVGSEAVAVERFRDYCRNRGYFPTFEDVSAAWKRRNG
jgi:hypothetical protein